MATSILTPSSSPSSEHTGLPSLFLGSPIALHHPMPPCSLEAIPSFDWSDFPVVGSSSLDENDEELSFLSSSSSSYLFQPQHFSTPAARSVFSFTEPPLARTPVPTSASVKDRQLSSPTSSDASTESSTFASSSTTTTTKSRKKARRSVGFQSMVQVRTYAVTLGDHPYCPGGLALTCDWTIQHEARVSMESLERHRPKKANELRLSYVQRRHRLVECTGLAPSELLQLEYEQDYFTRQQEELPVFVPAGAESEGIPQQKHLVFHHRSRPLHHAQPSDQLNLLA